MTKNKIINKFKKKKLAFPNVQKKESNNFPVHSYTTFAHIRK